MMSSSVILLLLFDVGCPRGPLFVDLYEDCGAESKKRILVIDQLCKAKGSVSEVNFANKFDFVAQ